MTNPIVGITEKQLTAISKYLSFVLRHKPDAIGLKLDSCGWASIDELVDKTTEHPLTAELVDLVAETNDKQRFAINSNRTKIRANQGHSIDVDLALTPLIPPEKLLHGTAERFCASIQEQGLSKGNRHHVHLTESKTVAASVGSRYGKLKVLEIDSKKMHEQGFIFYRSANNVWLVDNVPTEFIHWHIS
ncbi:RNA 2'-phosphotransferase [Endozoicomonas sp. G2_1]|uniref:RNA 2'-phosphotransferase n=1 Tax=Endozoicomonas sp. G2_1 TaxID=2821091 RepID=UPI001ADC379E|nr:RNA 2'-phosphotransferase [Endozoicomonas sp. G2_1]MBO9489798.1 RNA 2'-phosphotransferase [Endozoicomonas sp. G2_1]